MFRPVSLYSSVQIQWRKCTKRKKLFSLHVSKKGEQNVIVKPFNVSSSRLVVPRLSHKITRGTTTRYQRIAIGPFKLYTYNIRICVCSLCITQYTGSTCKSKTIGRLSGFRKRQSGIHLNSNSNNNNNNVKRIRSIKSASVVVERARLRWPNNGKSFKITYAECHLIAFRIPFGRRRRSRKCFGVIHCRWRAISVLRKVTAFQLYKIIIIKVFPCERMQNTHTRARCIRRQNEFPSINYCRSHFGASDAELLINKRLFFLFFIYICGRFAAINKIRVSIYGEKSNHVQTSWNVFNYDLLS